MEQQDNDRQETDNSRLARAKRKLERLKREYSAQISRVVDHQAQTNGQPMNDKANGRSFFNRQEQLEGRARTLLREIEAQEERISTLEHQKERKELGLNNQGGLIMSVDNIPMIKAEIEQAKQGNSMYSTATIRKYEKQLVELEELKRRSERAGKHMNEQAQKMIESGRLTQWKKNPMIYFVKGYRKLAVELTESGTFEPSQRYAAKTEAEQSVISDILNELKFDTEEIPNATKDQEAALNHFYRVEFNEGSENIRNFEGEIVSQPLIEEIKRLDRPMESGYYKFYFQEIKDGEIVDAFRLDVGDGVNSNQDYYKKLESLAAQDKTNVVTNERSKAAYYLRIENHAEGAFFRIFTDEENIFKSTVASYEFDLHAKLTEENIWFSQDHKEAEEKLNADFLVNNRLNPKYLSSFISQWNDYKKQNNVYMGLPIDHGLIEFDPIDYYKGTALPLTQGKLTIDSLDTQKKVEHSEEKRSVKKRKSAEELKKETDQLVKDAMENIKNHFDDPEDVLELGAFMSKFYNYSLKNTALIQEQLPHAHAVAGAKKFKEAGFFIRKGEKAIRVLAPTTYKCFINEQGRMQSLSKATKLQKEKILKGELKTEERRAFKNVPVFDISQTTATADDLPKIFPNRPYNFDLTKATNTKLLYQSLETYALSEGLTIIDDLTTVTPVLGTAKGAYGQGIDGSEMLFMNPRFTQAEQVPTMIHELAHAKLHSKTSNSTYSSSVKEFQAELAAYIVAHHYGIDTKEESIPYIAAWTKNGQTVEDKLAQMEEVKVFSRQMIEQIDTQLMIQQELEQQEQEKAPTVEKQKLTESQKTYRTFSEQIAFAKTVSILDIALKNGIDLIQDSKKQYRLADNHSLVITTDKNLFIENNGNFGGGPIDFVQKVVGIEDFKSAVHHITDSEYEISDVEPSEQREFIYNKDNERDFVRAKKYLIDDRCIDEEIVSVIHNKGLLQQDKRNNVLLLWNDHGKITFSEQIAFAKTVSILDIALKNGIDLIQDSKKQYRLADNHSLVITADKNLFIENNGNFGGGPIDFVQKVVGIEDFKSAVHHITDSEYEISDVVPSEQREFTYNKENERDFVRAKKYLTEDRCIDEEIVSVLHNKGLLQQDKRNNVLLLWNDHGKIAGCSEKGTIPDSTWKHIQAGSDSKIGFNVRNGEPKKLKFFEAGVDLMSYMSLNKSDLKDTWFVSMEGLKPETVYHYLEEAQQVSPSGIEEIALCVDNDEAGKAFFDKFQQFTFNQKEKAPLEFQAEFPQAPVGQETQKWDWNNELVYQVNEGENQRKKSLESEPALSL